MRLFLHLAALISALLIGLPAHSAASSEIILLNWADYLDPDLIEQFEQRTGIKVKEVYFDSDSSRDQLLLQSEGQGYDLTIVNGVSVLALSKRGWLEPITDAEIPNLKHIAPRWRDAFELVDTYGVPYFWGTLGIAYRNDLVPAPPTSWMDLFQPPESLRGKVVMINDSRDVIGAALKALGYSLNSTDNKELHEAERLLQSQAAFVKTYDYISLDESSALATGQVAMSLMYSGDALMLQEHNENIEYVLPKEGGNLWVDYLCVLKGSSNKAAAKQFINFLNEPEIAAQLAQYVYYASPNQAAEKLLPAEFTSDPVIYPAGEALENSETYQQLFPRAEKRRISLFSRIVP